MDCVGKLDLLKTGCVTRVVMDAIANLYVEESAVSWNTVAATVLKKTREKMFDSLSSRHKVRHKAFLPLPI